MNCMVPAKPKQNKPVGPLNEWVDVALKAGGVSWEAYGSISIGLLFFSAVRVPPTSSLWPQQVVSWSFLSFHPRFQNPFRGHQPLNTHQNTCLELGKLHFRLLWCQSGFDSSIILVHWIAEHCGHPCGRNTSLPFTTLLCPASHQRGQKFSREEERSLYQCEIITTDRTRNCCLLREGGQSRILQILTYSLLALYDCPGNRPMLLQVHRPVNQFSGLLIPRGCILRERGQTAPERRLEALAAPIGFPTTPAAFKSPSPCLPPPPETKTRSTKARRRRAAAAPAGHEAGRETRTHTKMM
ncbi:PREDICTED: uncharacterized protein LOC106901576 [Calidris pugnax]|uniref:uncharacterized protein LOC106901576 n=1 Tax=Calidris pugnax TaxID=198806 RepID=UPI00071C8267|nr:PREDICTED: uncharacterized protein LOC106901576 [Calidris pugnax]